MAESSFPFPWVDLDYFPNSKASHCIVRSSTGTAKEQLKSICGDIVGHMKEDIRVYDDLWWEWDISDWHQSPERMASPYGKMLTASGIPKSYSGSCEVLELDGFLDLLVPLLISGKTPYSPVFHDLQGTMFFYLHHTGDVGIYYLDGLDPLFRSLILKYEVLDVTGRT